MNGDRRNKWNEEHENVNQSCLYNEDKECIIKDIVSLSKRNYHENKKYLGICLEKGDINNDIVHYNVKEETKKYLKRMFDETCCRDLIINKNIIFDFNTFFKELKKILDEKIFNMVYNIYYNIINKNTLKDESCEMIERGHDEELVETNYYKNEINLVSNNENLELTSNVSFLYETTCPHTGIKKLVVGGNQCATSDDKYILIFGIKNSNKFILLKRIFHFLYKLSNINDIYHFNKELYKTNESKEMCIYEFNNSKIPYKICVIDCPEYDVSHDQMKKKFTMKRLYKEFLRKYVFSKGYLLLSSVIITVNEKLNLKFLKEIKKLKIFFKECDNPNVFEKCFNGKFINNENDVIYMNDMDEYFKKIENNYQILLKTSLI